MFPSLLGDFQQPPSSGSNTTMATTRQLPSSYAQPWQSPPPHPPHPPHPPPPSSSPSALLSSSLTGPVAANGIGSNSNPIAPPGTNNATAATASAAAVGGLGLGLAPPGGLSAFLPTAPGQQMDLNYLWQQVQELSAVLAQNREATHGVILRVGELQRRALKQIAEGHDGPSTLSAAEVLQVINGESSTGQLPSVDLPSRGFSHVDWESIGPDHAGESSGAPAPPSSSAAAAAAAATAAVTIADLQHQNQALTDRNAFLESENWEIDSLLQAYITGMDRVVEQIRMYSHDNTMATLAIHRSYTDQLAAERATNLEIRQEHFEWQSRLRRLSTILREAYRESLDEDALTEISLIVELKNENRLLRRIIGLPVDPDSDDEDERNNQTGRNANVRRGSGQPLSNSSRHHVGGRSSTGGGRQVGNAPGSNFPVNVPPPSDRSLPIIRGGNDGSETGAGAGAGAASLPPGHVGGDASTTATDEPRQHPRDMTEFWAGTWDRSRVTSRPTIVTPTTNGPSHIPTATSPYDNGPVGNAGLTPINKISMAPGGEDQQLRSNLEEPESRDDG